MDKRFLNEDGSLNVRIINKLPDEDYIKLMGKLTQEQVKEYNSKLPINESKKPIQAVRVNGRRGVDATKFLNEMRKRYIDNLQ